jgi:hypothetical protein
LKPQGLEFKNETESNLIPCNVFISVCLRDNSRVTGLRAARAFTAHTAFTAHPNSDSDSAANCRRFTDIHPADSWDQARRHHQH